MVRWTTILSTIQSKESKMESFIQLGLRGQWEREERARDPPEVPNRAVVAFLERTERN